MAESKVINEEEKVKGGNRNAIAYGLLQGAGVNINGLSPSQAWELVSQLNLLENKQWKRTTEDKANIKQKNLQFKESGKTLESIKKEALKYSKVVDFFGVGNKAALQEAVETVSSIMSSYQLNNLQVERAKMLANSTMASANDSTLNIGKRLLRNPNAAYRIGVENFSKTLKEDIDEVKKAIMTANSFNKQRLEQRLRLLERQKGFNRHNVIYKGEEVKSVVAHEMGHVLAGQLFGFISAGMGSSSSSTNKAILDCYNKSKKNGDIRKISAYADSDPDEFFAECFTIYTMGKEKLPENINKMMEGVLSKWKR